MYLNKVLFSIWFTEIFYIWIADQDFCRPFSKIKIIRKIKIYYFPPMHSPFYLFIYLVYFSWNMISSVLARWQVESHPSSSRYVLSSNPSSVSSSAVTRLKNKTSRNSAWTRQSTSFWICDPRRLESCATSWG